jgi:hypothetical protein
MASNIDLTPTAEWSLPMPQAVSSHSRVVPEIPRLEDINFTLDPGGDQVVGRREEIYSDSELREGGERFKIRNLIADEIERLMSILDAIDGDPDLESSMCARYDGDPRLDDCECDQDENEPDLGSVDGINQTGWAQGGNCRYLIDREIDLSERFQFYR